MDWKQLLASITGSVDEELLLRNEYLVTENRILHNQVKGRVHLSDGERKTLARRYLLYGASPRGAQSLALGGKAMARLRGRAVVTAEDVRTVLVRSLQHRIILNFEGVAPGIAPRDILANVLEVTREDPARAELSASASSWGSWSAP